MKSNVRCCANVIVVAVLIVEASRAEGEVGGQCQGQRQAQIVGGGRGQQTLMVERLLLAEAMKRMSLPITTFPVDVFDDAKEPNFGADYPEPTGPVTPSHIIAAPDLPISSFQIQCPLYSPSTSLIPSHPMLDR